MIDGTETRQVVEAAVRARAKTVTFGIQTKRALLPVYSDAHGKATSLCRAARSSADVGRVCRKFYADIQDRRGDVTCPYGIRLSYTLIEHPSYHFGLFVQTSLDPAFDAIAAERMKALPRRPKKRVAGACTLTREHKFAPFDLEAIDFFPRLVETLLAGNNAEAIRAVAHDIQTPLQGAMADALALKEITRRDDTDEVVKEKVDRLATGLYTITNLAGRIPLLLASDLEHNPAQLRAVAPHLVIDDIRSRLHSEASKKGLLLTRGFNPVTTVEAVPDHFRMVFQNLLENAVKYSFNSPPGRPNRVEVSFQKNGDFLEVTISNRGCQMTEDELKEGRLFELGYRGSYSTDRGRRGTGSGLNIARRLALGHGGDITATSDPISKMSNGTWLADNRFVVSWPQIGHVRKER